MKNLQRLALMLMMALTTGVAHAEVCNARFFHDGGEIEIGGSGILSLNARLAFSQVKKNTPEVCQAHVRGFAKYAYMGLLNGSNNLDHLMKVNAGHRASLSPVRASRARQGSWTCGCSVCSDTAHRFNPPVNVFRLNRSSWC